MIELFFGTIIAAISFWIGREVSEAKNQRKIIFLEKEAREWRDLATNRKPVGPPQPIWPPGSGE